MQQLLGLEELGVVERCELAARLLLGIRGDLVPHSYRPAAGTSSWAWWQVQVWEDAGDAAGDLQAELGEFLTDFFRLAGQVRTGSTALMMESLSPGHRAIVAVLCL
jgi:hypothetical protein